MWAYISEKHELNWPERRRGPFSPPESGPASYPYAPNLQNDSFLIYFLLTYVVGAIRVHVVANITSVYLHDKHFIVLCCRSRRYCRIECHEMKFPHIMARFISSLPCTRQVLLGAEWRFCPSHLTCGPGINSICLQ